MTRVVIGTNSFEDCTELVALHESLLLHIEADPLAVTLITPDGDDRLKRICVERNVAKAPDVAVVSTTGSSVAVFYEDQLLVMASVTSEGTINATLDLRPLGIRLFSNASGLMVGNSRLAGNRFVRGRAINLAD